MELKLPVIRFFRDKLLQWHYQDNNRIHPWAGTKDPYKIWLSEIIMQQTRLEQGTPYYERFVTQYPSIKDLATAKDEAVFKLWQGLGYYNRCRNMLATARFIVKEKNGKFPEHYEDILKLKGIGNYTAAAIAAFAYGLPYAVLDGNVYRLLARFLGLETPIDSSEGKKLFTRLAQCLLDEQQPATYNQAIMDFGATICRPKNPQCGICPLAPHCVAYQQGSTGNLPVKEKKIKVKTREFNYLVLRYNDLFFVHQRDKNDVWEDLYEFYLLKEEENLLKNRATDCQKSKPKLFFTTQQRLTHQLIKSKFYWIEVVQKPLGLNNGKWVSVNGLEQLAVSKTLSEGINALKKLLMR